MTGKLLTTHTLAVGLLTLLFGAASAQDTTKKDKKDKDADPPRTAVYMGQLRTLFAKWDLDKDDYLDKKELAVAFRGPGSKPFDYKAPKDSGSELKTEDKSTKDTTKPDSEKGKSDKKPDYSKIPDYQFLTMVDTDMDEKISRKEFISWSRDYAVQLRDQDEAVKNLLKLQQQLKANPKNKKGLEGQINKQEQQIKELKAKLKRYQKLKNLTNDN